MGKGKNSKENYCPLFAWYEHGMEEKNNKIIIINNLTFSKWGKFKKVYLLIILFHFSWLFYQ